MNRNTLVLINSIYLLVSCNYDSKEDKGFPFEVVEFESNYTKDVNFISDTTYIPLEFCEDCIIGDISKVIKVDDGFIISDKTISQQVFKFDDSGNFLFSIGEKGVGLGNYVLPFDLSKIPGTNKLAILDQNQSKILYYDIDTGDFIEEWRINFQAKSFYYLDSNTIAAHLDGNFMATEQDSMAVLLDLTKNIFIYKGVVDFPKTDHNATGGDFHDGTEGVLFTKSLNDTVYSVTPKGFSPKYVFDFGDKTVPDAVKKLPMTLMFEELMKSLPYYHNGNVIENEKYLFYNWWAEDEEENFGVYNKKTKENISLRGDKVIFKRPFYVTDDYMLCYLINYDYERLGAEPNFGKSENQIIIKVNFD